MDKSTAIVQGSVGAVLFVDVTMQGRLRGLLVC